MLTFNTLEILTLISNFFWPMVRILSFFSVAPIFNHVLFNKKNKILLSGMISWLIYPFLPEIHTILFSFLGLTLFFQQIVIGIVLGFVVQFLFFTISLAGEVISLQMGLSFATIFNNNMHVGDSIISRLLNILAIFFFLAINAHLQLISVLINSFYSVPIDSSFLNTDVLLVLLKFSSYFFLNGMLFVLPVVIILLALSFIMSFLNRFSPQISIFSIGFPLNLLVGMLILYFFIPNIFPFFENLFNDLLIFITDSLLKI